MRWDALFGDLEAQLAAAETADLAVAVAEGVRYEIGRATLVQRLRAAAGDRISVGVTGATIGGRLAAVGPDWLLLDDPAEVLVPTSAVGWVQGLPRGAAVDQPGRVWERLSLRSALKGLARDRAVVEIAYATDESVTGTIDRVGADHLDLAVHAADEPRRADAVRGVRTIAFAALRTVRRR